MNTSTWCFLNEGQRSALLARKDCKAEVLPKHMNAAGSIKSVWTLIFKCTLKLSHLIAAVSQAAFCVIRSMHCWLKIWQPKVLWLVDLTSMAAGYLAQNPIWKKDSLTNYHYFKKKQSLARFVSTCDEMKKEKQTLNHNYVSLASQCQLRPHFLPTWAWICLFAESNFIQNKSWSSSNHT